MAIGAVLALAACDSPVGPVPARVFTSVLAGEGFSCGLTSDGRAWCWGGGPFGQLGNGATDPSAVPVAVAGDHEFASLTVGNAHACAVDTDGVGWCWGLNDFRELGSRTTTCNNNLQFLVCASTPVRVSVIEGLSGLSAAGYGTCAVVGGSVAYCWGWTTHGQLGVGLGQRVVQEPLAIVGGLTFAQLSLGEFHACGLTALREAFCWGANPYGQLGGLSTDMCVVGTASVPCSAQPIAAGGNRAWALISSGKTHTCGIVAEGSAYCWGSNQYGVLGTAQDSIGFAEIVPVAGGRTWRALSAGQDHACGVSSDGTAWCWGLDDHGQLGGTATGTESCAAFGTPTPCRITPQAVAITGVTFSDISAGVSHTCALSSEGEVWCWGRGTEGQLGAGAFADSRAAVRIAIPD